MAFWAQVLVPILSSYSHFPLICTQVHTNTEKQRAEVNWHAACLWIAISQNHSGTTSSVNFYSKIVFIPVDYNQTAKIQQGVLFPHDKT